MKRPRPTRMSTSPGQVLYHTDASLPAQRYSLFWVHVKALILVPSASLLTTPSPRFPTSTPSASCAPLKASTRQLLPLQQGRELILLQEMFFPDQKPSPPTTKTIEAVATFTTFQVHFQQLLKLGNLKTVWPHSFLFPRSVTWTRYSPAHPEQHGTCTTSPWTSPLQI